MNKKPNELTLEDLEPQYAAFCEEVKNVKQNTFWNQKFNTAFHHDEKE